MSYGNFNDDPDDASPWHFVAITVFGYRRSLYWGRIVMTWNWFTGMTELAAAILRSWSLACFDLNLTELSKRLSV